MNESEKRDKWLKIRISEREKEVIDTKFRNSGMKNVSDFIRAMIFVGVIVKFSDADRKQLLRDFSAMSNNINQIARKANAGFASREETTRALRMLDEVYGLLYEVAKR